LTADTDATEPRPSQPAPQTGPARTLILVPIVRTRGGDVGRTRDARIEEAIGLARAIDLDVVEAVAVPRAEFRSATLIGKGKVEEIGARVAADHVALVIIDGALSPVQQRNLERAWKTKVIDRTGLILEIFGERAETREGRLQVELAHLNYQKSRLVRSWTHLERQRGGFGFLGGPGETQIEADRRQIEERIARIEKELESVAGRRRQQRKNRAKATAALVAIVGYTNAGKSTLFNRLTNADVFADNRLFATLDPTVRTFELPHGTTAVLSDTVGFVANLPTMLVAAFRATLEEVAEADVILHVRDIAHPDSEAQAKDVAVVLEELGIDANSPERIIEVWNKIDLLPRSERPQPIETREAPSALPVSAITGEGIDELLAAIEQRISGGRRTYAVELAGAALGNLHRLYELTEVIDRSDTAEGTILIHVRVPQERDAEFRRLFPMATATDGARVARSLA
jgi:GTP-binding protein HflX